MKEPDGELRYRNPFREAASSELFDDPEVFSKIFSQEILVNETLDVFEKSNVVLTGPQGTGKTMILCLFQHSFLSACLKTSSPAGVLKNIQPYFSISVNLVRSGFHVFGRRSPSRAIPPLSGAGENVNAQGAADVLCHMLFHQLLTYLQFLFHEDGSDVAKWMKIDLTRLSEKELATSISKWPCWRGYYSRRTSFSTLMRKCRERLDAWNDFLNVNTDSVPESIWKTTPPLEDVVHSMGAMVASLGVGSRKLPLYVVIDQYEVLPELNQVYGSDLQRIVNSLFKARDPYVFYKLGARPYDWGKELRIWGSESRIEVDRDYKIVNIIDILRQSENMKEWLFPRFAADVASRRVKVVCNDIDVGTGYIKGLFGKWSEADEVEIYSGRAKARRSVVLKNMPALIRSEILSVCGENASALDLRLASAWVYQQLQRNVAEKDILSQIHVDPAPWNRSSWRKERVEIALLQIASMTNQRKYYFGWNTILYLSGSDIRAFLRICEEVWELAAKVAPLSLQKGPVSRLIQTEGIFEASHHWRLRDRTETHGGGSLRYAVLGRLGPAIHDYLMKDLAISNPGYSGFSVREPDLNAPEARRTAEFLGNGVNWAIFEERLHTSKNGGASRSKWFLHPILAPAFGIPLKRVKEPYYTTVKVVGDWINQRGPIRFGSKKHADKDVAPSKKKGIQRQFQFGEDDEASVG